MESSSRYDDRRYDTRRYDDRRYDDRRYDDRRYDDRRYNDRRYGDRYDKSFDMDFTPSRYDERKSRYDERIERSRNDRNSRYEKRISRYDERNSQQYSEKSESRYSQSQSSRRNSQTSRRNNESSSRSQTRPYNQPPRSRYSHILNHIHQQTEYPSSIDDHEGHLIILNHTFLSDRYKIISLLGQGTFGKVVKAYDCHSQTHVAIKIIKAIQKYTDASKIEIKILEQLQYHDPNNLKQCIHLRDCFVYENHICMVFDLLSQSLFDYFKSVHFSPFSLRQIQSFAHQLLISVAFLHDLGLIHTDLKPENLMLVDNETKAQPVKNSKTKTRKMLVSTKIILIDFGSTIADIDHHSNVVSTRHYRAPEIILNLGWSYPCDIWSLGCILVELYTGIALFQTHEDMEHLKMMEIVLGAFPTHMINKVPDMNEGIFRYNGTINYPSSNTEQSSQAFLERMETIQSIIRPRTEFEQLFLEFIKSLLTFDPYQRINAHQALNHPFITFR